MAQNGVSAVADAVGASALSAKEHLDGAGPSRSLDGSHSDSIDHQSGQTVDSADRSHPEDETRQLKLEKSKLLQAQGIFALANGFIRFERVQLTKKDTSRNKSAAIPDDQSPLDQDQDDAPIAEYTKTGMESTFRIIARRCNQPIVLFGDQMMRLVDELPNAYKAFESSDDSYKHVLVKNEKNMVTLEVNFWQDKKYLYLKRYFKGSDDYRGGSFFTSRSDNDGWVAAKGWVSFDPDQDHPIDILKYIIMCC